MAIKIECKRCGFSNDLGKVFCAQCGQRLDLAHTGMEELGERAEFEVGPFIRKLVILIIVLALAAVAGLALWPRAPRPVAYDAAGVKQVFIKARALKTAVYGRVSISRTFPEGEINGHLATRREANGLTALWMDVRPGEFELGAERCFAPLTNQAAFKNISWTISYCLSGTFNGGQLVVRKGELGHLPMIGPTIDLPERWFAAIFADVLRETNLIAGIKEIRLENDNVVISVGR